MLVETPIILGVDSAEIDPATPQTAVDKRFMHIHTRVVGGELDVRVSVEAAPTLAEAIMSRTMAVKIDAKDIVATFDKATNVATLRPITRGPTALILLSRDTLERLHSQLADLLAD